MVQVRSVYIYFYSGGVEKIDFCSAGEIRSTSVDRVVYGASPGGRGGGRGEQCEKG